jgi:FtsP/CotA-like multicopper oxidase with cupredoxin domain
MKIHVTGAPKQQSAIPATFRFVPNIFALFGANAQPRDQRVALTSAGGGRNHFTLNGKIFNDTRIDNVVTFNQPEIWNIDNKNGNWAHPMHLHNIQFQVIDINDRLEPQNNPKWKDVVNVPRSGRARFINRFNNRKGMFFFHCHILQHEDDGLMTTAFIEDNAPVFQGGPIPGGLGNPPLKYRTWCGPSPKP